MSKRQAAEALGELVTVDSPLPKRTKVQTGKSPDIGQLNGQNVKQNGVVANGAHLNDKPIDTNEDDEEDENENASAVPTRNTEPLEGYSDLYLDTINRAALDFDFEKLCSVTLSNINIYACLVCGTYFQGRGPKSQAYFHALDSEHHVFINLSTKIVYVLPEGYQVHSKALDDIKYVVDPSFDKSTVSKLDRQRSAAWDLQGKKYNPGYIGMNNIKANDYFNVVCHTLSHVVPLRNYFILEDVSNRPEIAQRYGTLVRKLWNSYAFKAHVSPHELLQDIALRSNKEFVLTVQSDPAELMAWFLNNLHLALGGSKTKPQSSIVQRIFQGQMRIESQAITARADVNDRLRFEDAAVQSSTNRFMILPLDLPPAPLFQDDRHQSIIPQVSLSQILSKYDGIETREEHNLRRRYRLLHPLPPFLMMHVKRFAHNRFLSNERNPTIVTFQPTSLDMSRYVEPNPALHPMSEPIIYDLVANITHEGLRARDDSVEGEAERKVWKVQLLDRGGENGEVGDRWWELQDLFVDRIEAEYLSTKEAYLMVWERRKTNKTSANGTSGKG